MMVTMMKVNLLIVGIYYFVIPIVMGGHIDLPEACVVHPYNKKSMDECDVAGEYWSLMVHNQRDIFTCCKNERDASIVAAPSPGRGLYYGDAYKLCETIYVDQETCRSRESRDCNYHTTTYKNQYIGCFFCRARCENDYQCGDLGRVCSICRPEQPATACTEPVFADSGPLKLYHGQSNQSGSEVNITMTFSDNNGSKQLEGQQLITTDESRSNGNSNQTTSG